MVNVKKLSSVGNSCKESVCKDKHSSRRSSGKIPVAAEGWSTGNLGSPSSSATCCCVKTMMVQGGKKKNYEIFKLLLSRDWPRTFEVAS